jgi:hypothetical protein
MKNSKPLFLSILFLTAFALKSCTSIEPDKPKESYLTGADLYQKELSMVNMPVELDLTQVEDRVNEQIADLLFEDEQKNSGNDFKIKIWKKDLIQINAEDDIFRIKVPLKIWAEAGLKFNNFGIQFDQRKDTEFEIDVFFDTRFKINENWQLESQTNANGFDWVKKPILKIGPVQIPLASFVEGILGQQQEEIASQINREIQPNLNIRQYVQNAWVQLQKPMKLSEEFDAWLKITPQQVLLSPFQGIGKSSRITIGISGFTETFIGREPEQVVNKELPALQLVDSISNQFVIGLSGEIGHKTIENILREHLLNQEFTYNNGKQQVQVKSINIYGQDRNLVLAAQLEGSVKGKIYLKGQPYFDELSQSIRFKNLDYDLDTKNKLVKTASWLAHGKFIKTMEEKLNFPLGSQMKDATLAIEQALDNFKIAEGIYLNGELEELTPSEVYITPKNVITTVYARGRSNMVISGLEMFSFK